MEFEFQVEVVTKNSGPVQDMRKSEVAAMVHEIMERALEEYLLVRAPWILSVDIV